MTTSTWCVTYKTRNIGKAARNRTVQRSRNGSTTVDWHLRKKQESPEYNNHTKYIVHVLVYDREQQKCSECVKKKLWLTHPEFLEAECDVSVDAHLVVVELGGLEPELRANHLVWI